ncbi:hypothetical protein GCM10023306_01390 [Novosphingobium ginsenosidimutans]
MKEGTKRLVDMRWLPTGMTVAANQHGTTVEAGLLVGMAIIRPFAMRWFHGPGRQYALGQITNKVRAAHRLISTARLFMVLSAARGQAIQCKTIWEN